MSRWTFSATPRAEFRELFWMLGGWSATTSTIPKCMAWTGRDSRPVSSAGGSGVDRDELNDVIAQMVGELSALHIFVHGGDARKAADHVDLASLGAVLRRDEKAGGFVVEHIYLHDPDLPNEAPPLARPTPGERGRSHREHRRRRRAERAGRARLCFAAKRGAK